MAKRYDVLLTRDEATGWYGAEVPDLPGCFSQGRTRDEALANVREAIALYLSDGREAPQPSKHLLDSVEVSVA